MSKHFSLLRKKKFLNKFLGVIFILVSASLLFGFPSPEMFDRNPSIKNPISIDKTILEGKTKTEKQNPTRIIIPQTKIDLSVVEAPVVKGYWELSEKTASHGVGSANPGEKGNVVIFAHARPNLFYGLKDVKKGNKIYVLTKNGWKSYAVTDIKTVYPKQTEVIKKTASETLTLYTCSGFYDEKRLVVQAKPI